MKQLWIPLCLGLSLAFACSDDSNPGASESGSETGECPVAAEGCPCSSGGSCDAGLVCEEGTCVPEGTEAGSDSITGDGDGDTTDTNGDGDGDATDTNGDGDGDTDTNGDGDGDTTDSGDGDGDPAPPNCGDAMVDYDEGEECDDGNNVDDDGCSSACQVEVGPACGDGALEPANAEECDDGNNVDDDGCSSTCQLEELGQSCGDNTIDQNEVCDDGNTQNGDSCNPTCNLGNTTTLFAGGVGVQGLVDGVGPAARFGGFANLAISNDRLWVSDGANNAIREIDIASASVTTIAGNGQAGDVDAGFGANARFAGPGAITTDGTTLWVADGANRKIKAIDLQPPYAVTTVAGNGVQQNVDGVGLNASFTELRALTYYNGKVYMLDGTVAVLRSFDVQSGEVLTIAGSPNNPGIQDGDGLNAQFISPRYMASDNSGMLYIADTNGYHIRSYNIATTFVGTFAGSGQQGYADGVGVNATIHRPRGMTSDGTSIYFTEFNQHTIRQGVLATQEISTLVGQDCGGGGNCNGGYSEGVGTQAQLDGPFDVVFHYPSNSLFFFDGANRVVRRIQ